MNWKAAILLLAIFFAPTVTTAAISLNAPKLGQLSTVERIVLHNGLIPCGDPVHGPGSPN